MRTAGIAGAGIVGRLLAFRLQEQGWKVSLFNAGPPGAPHSCSSVAAGMLAPFAELDKAEPLVLRLGLESIRLWEALLPRLDREVHFQKSGSLVLAHPRDAVEAERFASRIMARLGPGANAEESSPVVVTGRVAECESALGHWKGPALFLPAEGQIEPAGILAALKSALITGGARWREGARVEALSPNKIVLTGGESHGFDLVCDCRGLGAGKDFMDLRGVRGELILVRAPEVSLTRPVRLLHPRWPLYVVPRPESRYVIGASEIESEDASPLSVRTALELLSAAYSLHPGFAEARIVALRSQCRPAFPDNLPRLCFSKGLLRINGLFRHGFLLSPALVEEAVRWAHDDSRPIRFPEILHPDPIKEVTPS